MLCSNIWLVDGDTGYGNFNNVRRLVRKLCDYHIAGVCIEDKLFPKTNSFVGERQPLAEIDEFCGRIKAGKDSQTDDDFVLVARVEALISGHGLDEALRRAEAYRRAGADMLFVLTRNPEDIRRVGEHLGGPLMVMTGPGGLAFCGMALADLAACGVRLVVDPATPLLAAYRAMRASYAAIAAGQPDPALGDAAHVQQDALHATIGLPAMLDVERRTVERESL